MTLTTQRQKPPYLPPVIKPVEGALVMRSDDAALLTILANMLTSLAPVEKAMTLAAIYEVKLWKSWMLGIAAKRWQKKLGSTLFHAYCHMFGSPTGVKGVESLMKLVTKWMLTGHDREETFSVGGFSTRELQFIANVVAIVRNATTEVAAEAAAAKLEAEQTDARPKITNRITVIEPKGDVPEVVVTERLDRWYDKSITVDVPPEVYDLSPEERLDIANNAVAEHTRRKRLLRWER